MYQCVYKQTLVIGLIILASLYLFFNHKDVEPLQPIQITWLLEAQELKNDIPQTKITFVMYEKKYDLGTYEGSCSAKQSQELESGELSGILCWFAGGGTEIGIFKEGKGIQVKKRIVDEGTEEEAGMKGNFEILFGL